MSHSLENHLPSAAIYDASRNRLHPSLTGKRMMILALLISVLGLAACTINPPVSAAPSAEDDAFHGAIADLKDYVMPTPAPTAKPDLRVVVDTGGARANIRSG